MSENSLWHKIRQGMGRGRHWDEATRHEEKLTPGVSDVSFCCGGKHGWMELKYLKAYPKRPGTIVRCPHYTPEQKNFLKAKGSKAGNAWLFAQIGRDHFLFDWRQAQEFGQLPKDELMDIATRVWISRMDWEELGKILSAGC